MKRISRLILIGAITLLVLTTACNMPAQVPLETLPATGLVTNTPLVISTVISDTPAPVIPITGMDVVSLQCQFCVNDETHAVLIMSSQAFFSVADPSSGVTCLSAKEMDGRRILLCRGAPNASFTLNVCVDNDNCLEFPITLQPCPVVPVTGAGTLTAPATFVPLTPIILTPRNTLNTPSGGPGSGSPATATAIVVPPTSAPSTPAPTGPSAVTPLPTTIATTEPPPPEPTSTSEPATVQPPPPSTTSGGGGGEDSFVICHIPPGNPDQRRTMTVSQSDWEDEHSQHGDTRGAC